MAIRLVFLARLLPGSSDGIRLGMENIAGRAVLVVREEDARQSFVSQRASGYGEAPHFEMCPGLLEIRYYAAQGVRHTLMVPGSSRSHMVQTNLSICENNRFAAVYALWRWICFIAEPAGTTVVRLTNSGIVGAGLQGKTDEGSDGTIVLSALYYTAQYS